MARVGVVGAGLIGGSWTALFLAHGHDVTVWDPAPDAEARVLATIERAWPALERLGLTPGASPDRVRFVASVGDAVDGATFVQESGPERLAVKHELGELMERVVDPAAVIASSTSGLLASDIQATAAHPGRFLVGHPFNPPHLLPLVEVVAGAKTSPDAVSAATAFYRSVGKQPVVLRSELPGHIANRLQVAVLREAFSLVAGGHATVAEVDAAMTNGPGARWALLGPFLTMQMGGGPGGIEHILTHLGDAFRAWSADLGEYPAAGTYEALAAAGVADEMAGGDAETLTARFDAALLDLLVARGTAAD